MNQTRKITLSAMFLALALVLPFITGQIPEFGQALTPMHFPVLLGSFFAGPLYGLIIGLIAPLLRQLLFGMPPFPMSLMMAFELGTYGVLGGFLFNQLKPRIKNDAISIYISLIIAMIVGRVIFSIAALIFTGATNFFVVFFGLFTGSIPGIILQIILIPILYLRLKRATT
jgi:riboflavin transporter FmnP